MIPTHISSNSTDNPGLLTDYTEVGGTSGSESAPPSLVCRYLGSSWRGCGTPHRSNLCMEIENILYKHKHCNQLQQVFILNFFLNLTNTILQLKCIFIFKLHTASYHVRHQNQTLISLLISNELTFIFNTDKDFHPVPL